MKDSSNPDPIVHTTTFRRALDLAGETDLDETARRALLLHEVEGEVLRILAPLKQSQRVRVLAAVLNLYGDDEFARETLKRSQIVNGVI